MKYELILKPNKGRMMKIVYISLALLVIGIVGYIISSIFYDEYVTYHYTFRGRRRPSGWPYWLEVFSGWMIAIGGITGISSFIMVMRKKSSFGLNKDGLMINLLGWNEVFIPWNEIASIQENTAGTVIQFHSITAVIEKYGGKQQVFLTQQYVAKEKNIEINRSTAKGDIGMFNLKLKHYFNEHKK